jgi:glycerol uptake facilitator protein
MTDEAGTTSEVRAREIAVEPAPLGRRLAAEFLGTALLVAIGAGAATVLAIGPLQRLGSFGAQIEEAPDDIRQQAIASFAPTFGDVLGVALAFALVLAVLIYAFGGVSGGHFNPAVTFALTVTRRFRSSDLLPYWVAQCVGAIAGAFVIAGIYGQNGAEILGVDVLFGATLVADGINQWQAILAEAALTFVLMSAFMAVAIDPRTPNGWSSLVVGFALGAGILAFGAATGGSANFARSLGPLIASLWFDTGPIPWGDLFVFAVGPLIGAAGAAFAYETITGLERIPPPPPTSPPVDRRALSSLEGEARDVARSARQGGPFGL